MKVLCLPIDRTCYKYQPIQVSESVWLEVVRKGSGFYSRGLPNSSCVCVCVCVCIQYKLTVVLDVFLSLLSSFLFTSVLLPHHYLCLLFIFLVPFLPCYSFSSTSFSFYFSSVLLSHRHLCLLSFSSLFLTCRLLYLYVRVFKRPNGLDTHSCL
jgi:hypothetical protein